MAIIEGLGDEVTWFCMFLIFMAIVAVAWISTSVSAYSTPVYITVTERNVRTSSSSSAASASQDVVTQEIIDGGEVNSAYVVRDTSGLHVLNAEAASVSESSPTTSSICSCSPQELEGKRNEEHNMRKTDGGLPATVATSTAAEVTNGGQEPKVAIRLKFLDDTQKLVSALLTDTIADFKRQHFIEEVSQGQNVRLIFNGKLLSDSTKSLQGCGWYNGCTVHCYFANSENQSSTQGHRNTNESSDGRSAQRQQEGTDQNVFVPGNFLNPIMGAGFIFLWLAWLKFSQFFNTTALFSLITCTIVYLVVFSRSLRVRPEHQEADGASNNSG